MLPPNSEPVVGKSANDAMNGGAFERYDFSETWTPVETVVDGDLAFQRGTFTTIATPKGDGDRLEVSGSFMRIYQRQPNGDWRMTRDMFNSSTPLTADPLDRPIASQRAGERLAPRLLEPLRATPSRDGAELLREQRHAQLLEQPAVLDDCLPATARRRAARRASARARAAAASTSRRELRLLALTALLPTLLGRAQIARQMLRATRAACPSACAGRRAPRAAPRSRRGRAVCAPLPSAASSSRRNTRCSGRISRSSARSASAFGDELARGRASSARCELGAVRTGGSSSNACSALAQQQVVDERRAVADAVIARARARGRRACARGSTPLAAARLQQQPPHAAAMQRDGGRARRLEPQVDAARDVDEARDTASTSRGRCATTTESGRSPKSQRARFVRVNHACAAAASTRAPRPGARAELALQRAQIAARRRARGRRRRRPRPQLQDAPAARARRTRVGAIVDSARRRAAPRAARSTNDCRPRARLDAASSVGCGIGQRHERRAAALSAARAGSATTLSREPRRHEPLELDSGRIAPSSARGTVDRDAVGVVRRARRRSCSGSRWPASVELARVAARPRDRRDRGSRRRRASS